MAIQTSASRYIYAEEEGSDLAVLFLFVTFTRSDEVPDKYAMITVYVNPQNETLVNAFIDRIYYDELNATQTSLQNFQHLYTAQLAQAEAFANHSVTTSDIESSVIQAAMQRAN